MKVKVLFSRLRRAVQFLLRQCASTRLAPNTLSRVSSHLHPHITEALTFQIRHQHSTRAKANARKQQSLIRMVMTLPCTLPHTRSPVQAPKNLPPAAKQAKILLYFQDSLSVFTLKELEKVLPGVASINAMQVKEYLQALQDEYAIRVEKIGSGNWYWCFRSDAKKAKENAINALKSEEERLMKGVGEAEGRFGEEMARRGEEEGAGVDRKALLEIHGGLMKELEELDRELARYSDNDPEEVRRKVEETKRLKDSAMRWTDNIDALESFIGAKTGDRTATAQVMEQACGEEYVVGEGLKEL